MATVTGVVDSGPFAGQTFTVTLPTARIPELNAIPPPLELLDKIPVFDTSDDKTVHTTLADLRQLIITGGPTVGTTPVLVGGRYEIIVDTLNISGANPLLPNRVLIPALMGKTYTLRRTGYGDLTNTDWLNLPSGGFELTQDTVRLAEVFIAQEYLTVAANTPGSGASIIDDIAIITSNTTLNSVHRTKLLHVQPASQNVIITLEDIAAAPENSIIPIETNSSGIYKTKLETISGQLIYFNNAAVTSLWLGTNEQLWLLVGFDGYYVLKASDSLTQVGQPFHDYVDRNNSVRARGNLILRSAQPRLFDFISTNSFEMVVSETDWNDPNKKAKGKFTLGTVLTGTGANFRLPDLQNQVFRSLNNVGGTDLERISNSPGILQDDELRSHTHNIKTRGVGNGSDPLAAVVRSNVSDGLVYGPIGATGGTETRGKNVGLIAFIKT